MLLLRCRPCHVRCGEIASRRDDVHVSVFEFEGVVATLLRDGTSAVVTSRGGPVRVDGHTVGVVRMDHPPPHRGELHPDGDELLYLVSGRIEVVVDDGDLEHTGTETRHIVDAGQAFLVPQGVWHRIEVLSPAHLVHVTPGPQSAHRPA
jgi:mannose-6-phosphate isomerase-like protein (cupin superfamily)